MYTQVNEFIESGNPGGDGLLDIPQFEQALDKTLFTSAYPVLQGLVPRLARPSVRPRKTWCFVLQGLRPGVPPCEAWCSASQGLVSCPARPGVLPCKAWCPILARPGVPPCEAWCAALQGLVCRPARPGVPSWQGLVFRPGKAWFAALRGLLSHPGKAWCPILARPGVQSWQSLVSNPGKAWCPILARPGVPPCKGCGRFTGAGAPSTKSCVGAHLCRSIYLLPLSKLKHCATCRCERLDRQHAISHIKFAALPITRCKRTGRGSRGAGNTGHAGAWN